MKVGKRKKQIKRGQGSDDEEGRKDSGVRGVDCDSDSDPGEGNFPNGSESEEGGEGGEDIYDGLAGTAEPRKGKGRKRKRPNSVAERVSSASVPPGIRTRHNTRNFC